MVQDGIERLHYYQRQYLGALDFVDEQSYQRDMRRRHSLAHHRWGIVTGLKLVESEVKDGSDTSTQVQIQPGMAIDGYGREIVVFTPYTLSSEEFMGYPTPRYCAVYIEYDEILVTNSLAGSQQCYTNEQYNRINETFRVLIDVDQSTQYGSIIVDNKVQTVDTGKYMAVQEFPDPLGARPHWRILLGRVMWDGKQFSPSKFLDDGRRYVGNVTAEIITPSTSLVVHGPPLPPTAPSVPDADTPSQTPPMEMTVQGKLTIDQLLTAKADIQLQGGMLDFYDGSIANDPTGVGGGSGLPLSGTFSLACVQRAEDKNGGKDLRLQIGAESSDANHFTIRSGTTDLLTVQGNGDAKLAVGSLTLQHDLNLGGKLALGNVQLANNKNDQGGIDTRLQIGANGSTNDRFLIAGVDKTGTGKAPPLFTVTSGGKVSFGGILELSNDLSIRNDLSIGGTLMTQGDLKVSGSGIFSQGVNVLGNATVEQNLSVTGSVGVQQNLSVSGALDVKGAFTAADLGVAGTANLQKGVNVKGSLTIGGSVEVAGGVHLHNNVRVDGALVTYGGLSIADGCLSKLFTMEETVSAGDVVVLSRDVPGSVRLTSTVHDRSVLGVVSTAATFILDGPPSERTGKNRIAVALMGVVQCKADADVAPIRVGDLLTTSKTPGHAQRLAVNLGDAVGTILGKAIGRLERGKGLIQIQVWLS